jgi:hypothetical protein
MAALKQMQQKELAVLETIITTGTPAGGGSGQVDTSNPLLGN